MNRLSEDPLEKYFKRTIKALLREAVKRGIYREDTKVEDILREG